MHKDQNALVISHEHLGDYALLTLESPAIASASEPGQFVMIRTSSLTHPLLRRPFCLHKREGKNITIFYQVVGQGTSLLSRTREGERLDLLGPLGKGFSIPARDDGETALVGGGRGIAPFFFLATELRARNLPFTLFYGGRSEADLPLRERFEARDYPTICSTDDGSFGYHGVISALLSHHYREKKPSHMSVCGPDAMMVSVAALTKTWGIPAEFSLESMMGCGFGACWGCVKRIKKKEDEEEGWQKICEDGPVFRGEEIIWEYIKD